MKEPAGVKERLIVGLLIAIGIGLYYAVKAIIGLF